MSSTAAAESTGTRFHEVIRQARLALDPVPTQEQLAARIGVTQPAISHWEKGRFLPALESVEKLADELKLDLGMLVRLATAERRLGLKVAS